MYCTKRHSFRQAKEVFELKKSFQTHHAFQRMFCGIFRVETVALLLLVETTLHDANSVPLNLTNEFSFVSISVV